VRNAISADEAASADRYRSPYERARQQKWPCDTAGRLSPAIGGL